MVLLPLLILLILKGSPFLFGCLVLILCLLGLDEYCRMALPARRVEGVLAALIGTAFLAAHLYLPALPPLLALTGIVLGFGILFLFRIHDMQLVARDLALVLMGMLYVPLLLAHLAGLRGLANGSSWLFVLMLIVMSGDTVAYYVGSAIGRRKLYPQVSPNKSIEGALGGLAGSMAGTLLAKFTFFPALRILDCIVLGILVGVLGQLGDLFESLLKRSFGVKDSGTIIPGHGGVLDRLDSILFGAPALYYYALFVFAG